MQNHNDTIKTSDTVLRKIYLSLYLKGLCVRRSWRPNKTATYWPPTLMAISVSFPFSWAAQPGAWGSSLSGCWFSLLHLISNSSDPNSQSGAWGLPLLGADFLYSIFSPTATDQSGAWGFPLLGGGFLYCILFPSGLIPNSSDVQTLNRGPEGSLCWVLAFSTASCLQLIWFSCALSYIIVQRPPFSCGRHKLHLFNPYTVKVILCYSSIGCTCYLHRCISYFDSPAGLEVNMQRYEISLVFRLKYPYNCFVPFLFCGYCCSVDLHVTSAVSVRCN